MIKTQLISFRKSASFPYKQAPLLRVKSHQCEDESRYMKAEAWLILLLPPFPSTTMQQLQISFLKTLLPPSIKHLFMLPAEKPLRSCDHMQNYITRNWWKFCYRRHGFHLYGFIQILSRLWIKSCIPRNNSRSKIIDGVKILCFSQKMRVEMQQLCHYF